jgi:hypothetical protein
LLNNVNALRYATAPVAVTVLQSYPNVLAAVMFAPENILI